MPFQVSARLPRFSEVGTMAERHLFICDVCSEEEIAACDGETPATMPTGWTQEGKRHYCVECSALNAAMDGEA
jgi:hypothetical protein